MIKEEVYTEQSLGSLIRRKHEWFKLKKKKKNVWIKTISS